MVFSNDCNLLQNVQIAIFTNCGYILLFSIRTNKSEISYVAGFYQLWCPFLNHNFWIKYKVTLWYLMLLGFRRFLTPNQISILLIIFILWNTWGKNFNVPFSRILYAKVKINLLVMMWKYTNLQKQYTTVKLQMHTCFIVAWLSWKYFT